MTGVINVYKEPGWTSSDVVNKLKGVLHERRIGHAGTLDPGAEGVLPVCVGNAARLFDYLTMRKKVYLAVIRFGKTTDTQDADGTVLEERPVAFSKDAFSDALKRFTGTILQTPPLYSALHFGGERLYELARRGEAPSVPAREVTVERLEAVTPLSDNACVLRVTCSKGTYIRTLCHDIGQKLGCGAYMEHLKREEAGGLRVENARRIGEIEEKMHAGDTSFLIPTDQAVAFLPRVDLSADVAKRLANGNPVPLLAAREPKDGTVRLYCGGVFYGIGEKRDDMYAIKCMLREDHGHDFGTGHL